MSTSEARPDPAVAPRPARIRSLDGLRGLAVLLVVVYHFAPHVLPAGFLGVDVFFVLSGFLITSLALDEHERSGRLRIGAFFGRRARRLLPAAVTTVVVVSVVAVLLEPAAARQPLRGQALASLLYGANWWSIAQGDSYQSAFAAESPLSHFWSLAVEEQFYLLFPLVVAGLALHTARRSPDRRRLARRLLVGSLVLGLASARLMGVLHDPLADPSRAYLGSDTRAQAVLAGVAAACALHLWRHRLVERRLRQALAVLAATGLVVVLGAALLGEFRATWLYHGGFAVVAVATAALVVALATGARFVARPFESRALVLLGVYSYGIYLWHWPVRVFLDEDRSGLSGVALFAARVGVTAVLTVASARLVEDRFRRRPPGHARPTPRLRRALGWVGAVAAATALVWVVAAPPTATGEASSDAPPPAEAAPPARPTSVELGLRSPAPPTGPTAASARIGPAAGAVRILWEGDSVAWTIGGGQLVFPQPDTYTAPFDPSRMVLWNRATYGCPVLDVVSRSMGEARRPVACTDRAQQWAAAMEEFRPDVVSWSGALRDVTDIQVDDRWLTFASPEWDEAYLAGLGDLRDLARSHGAALLLLGQPDPEPDPGEQIEEGLLPENQWRWGHLRDLQRRFAAEHPADTRYADLQNAICPDGACTRQTADGHPFRVDSLHWSAEGSTAVAPSVAAAIEQALAPSFAPATAS